MSDGTTINLGVGGDVIATDDIGGSKYQRVKLIHGADGVNAGDVSSANGLPVTLIAGSTVAGPALTKGSQTGTGFSTQDLKDSGRVIVNAASDIGGIAAGGGEAMFALNVSRDGVGTASITSIPVTAGKRYRVTGIMAGIINTGAAVMSVRVSLRLNPSGAAINTSPIIMTIPLSSGPAVAQQGNEMFVPLPDGTEFSGTMQIGLSQSGSASAGTLWASILGYEY